MGVPPSSSGTAQLSLTCSARTSSTCMQRHLLGTSSTFTLALASKVPASHTSLIVYLPVSRARSACSNRVSNIYITR